MLAPLTAELVTFVTDVLSRCRTVPSVVHTIRRWIRTVQVEKIEMPIVDAITIRVHVLSETRVLMLRHVAIHRHFSITRFTEVVSRTHINNTRVLCCNDVTVDSSIATNDTVVDVVELRDVDLVHVVNTKFDLGKLQTVNCSRLCNVDIVGRSH